MFVDVSVPGHWSLHAYKYHRAVSSMTISEVYYSVCLCYAMLNAAPVRATCIGFIFASSGFLMFFALDTNILN